MTAAVKAACILGGSSVLGVILMFALQEIFDHRDPSPSVVESATETSPITESATQSPASLVADQPCKPGEGTLQIAGEDTKFVDFKIKGYPCVLNDSGTGTQFIRTTIER